MEHTFEKVTEISFDLFNSLPKSGKPKTNEWTVLSCIVKENYSSFEAVALGTGSKCIGKNKMSIKGDILNDSHAEVICRRAFLLYLYEQMENSLGNKNSIFIYDEDSLKFNLKNDIKFHFFTTLMPCGDASIFPKLDDNGFNIGDLVRKKQIEDKKRSLNGKDSASKKLKSKDGDIFRTGAKCLDCDKHQDPREEGVGYHVTNVVRTKPGRGDPTLSVSCSDKLAKWCHVGIQGALLSILLKKPVYLSSFTVTSNTPFSEKSLQRAFLDRLLNVKMIFPYKKCQLEFCQAKCAVFLFQKDENKEVCPSSINWFRSENLNKPIEVAVEGKKQGVTKKNRDSAASRLMCCKIELFRRFLKLCDNLNENFRNLSYGQCKEQAVMYQKNWDILKREFRVWPKKDETFSGFHLNEM